MATIPSIGIPSTPVVNVIRNRAWNLKPLGTAPTLVDGIFEGGGTLGTAYVGSLRALSDQNIWFSRVVGNSAGAITAALVSAGFSAAEIQWLSAAYPESPPVPPSLKDSGITTPIHFTEFLDVSTFSKLSTTKERTFLWNAFKGDVVDEISRISLPLKPRDQLATSILESILDFGLKDIPVLGDLTLREFFKKIPGAQAEPLKKSILNTLSAAGYPATPLYVKDLLPIIDASSGWREQFADAAWSATIKNSPIAAILTSLLHEGGIFEGDTFLEKMRDLISKKFNNLENRPANQPVLFKDLKIPLAVIASDLDASDMVVYSAKTHPNMEVAEAVRRSMSVPFFFQPRGLNKNIVDGGLCSNFPAWLLSDGGRGLIPQTGGDDTRVKVGFQLEDSQAADAGWHVQPAKYLPEADGMAILKEMLSKKYMQPNLNPAQMAAFRKRLDRQLDDITMIREMTGIQSLDHESSSRPEITRGLMTGRTYFDVKIPLRGYHWLDFDINSNEDHTQAMWDRGWHAAIESLSHPPFVGPAGAKLITSENAMESPYRGL